MESHIVSFFESIKSLIHLFYKRTVIISEKEIDFSFLVATFLNLSIVWILKFVVEYIQDFEKKYFSIKASMGKKAEDLFNANLQNSYLNEERKNNKIIMMVKFSAKYIKRDNIFGKTEDLNEKRIEIEKNVLNNFFEIIEKDLNHPAEMLDNCVLLNFQDFNKVDEYISKIEKITSSIKENYPSKEWQINSIMGIDAYSKTTELILKAKNLNTLLKIFINSEITCLGTFKQRYMLQKKQNYSFEPQGIYKIEDNEEVFILKKLQ